MKDRTLQILQNLIEDFIETANPVASRRLLQEHNLKISSATVRNEFALLEEVGLICSPHVSSGKVPTEKGFRFFVDELLKEEDETMVTSLFERHLEQYQLARSKEIVFDALRILAQMSGNVAFVTMDNDQTFYLGLSNVLRCPEFVQNPEQAAAIVEILEGRERFQSLLSSLEVPENEVKIFIGEENMLEEISSCAMLVTSFQCHHASGKMGVLGPMRMRYGFNRGLLKQVLRLME